MPICLGRWQSTYSLVRVQHFQYGVPVSNSNTTNTIGVTGLLAAVETLTCLQPAVNLSLFIHTLFDQCVLILMLSLIKFIVLLFYLNSAVYNILFLMLEKKGNYPCMKF